MAISLDVHDVEKKCARRHKNDVMAPTALIRFSTPERQRRRRRGLRYLRCD